MAAQAVPWFGAELRIGAVMVSLGEDCYYDIVWARTHKSFPWWPCIICDPILVSDPIVRQKALAISGKKNTLYCYGDGTFDFSTCSQCVPYEDYCKEYSQQKVAKRYQRSFAEALRCAREEYRRSKESRISWLRSSAEKLGASPAKRIGAEHVNNKRRVGDALCNLSPPCETAKATKCVAAGSLTTKKSCFSHDTERAGGIAWLPDDSRDVLPSRDASEADSECNADEFACDTSVQDDTLSDLIRSRLRHAFLTCLTDDDGGYKLEEIRQAVTLRESDMQSDLGRDISEADFDNALEVEESGNKIMIVDGRVFVI